jgi:hypothetical protein
MSWTPRDPAARAHLFHTIEAIEQRCGAHDRDRDSHIREELLERLFDARRVARITMVENLVLMLI